MKKFFKLIITVFAGTLFGITSIQAATPVHAADTYYHVGKIRHQTPTKWRGNWYSYVNGSMCVTHINRYSVSQSYKGKKHTLFKSSWQG